MRSLIWSSSLNSSRCVLVVLFDFVGRDDDFVLGFPISHRLNDDPVAELFAILGEGDVLGLQRFDECGAIATEVGRNGVV